MLKIGLTGNIASGKTTVENIIAKSYKIIDLDKISHEALETSCKDEILKTFGTIKRNELAEIVFRNKKELKKLENIIHPRLKDYILNYFTENKEEEIIFVSGALIYEAGFNVLFDKIIFVDCDKNIRLKRLMKRNSYDEETAKLRIEAQTDKFKNMADFIILNNGNLEELENETKKVLTSISD